MSLSSLHPSFKPWAQALYLGAERAGWRPRITSTYRSVAEQQRLYQRRQDVLAGRLPPSAQPYPVAPPGSSRHNYGAAVDMHSDVPGALAYMGRVWRSWGGFWSPSDDIHFGDVG